MKNEQNSIYVMISRTPTRFAYWIRKFGKVHYNHAALALDPQLEKLYAFARKKHSAVLSGGLVPESVGRYTLRRFEQVDIILFEIPVSKEDYKRTEDLINRILKDKEYRYNLFSVLSFPLTRGFSTYKAFSCIEFVMYALREIGMEMEKKPCKYKPDDLIPLLEKYIIYRGNLLEYKADDGKRLDYFNKMTAENYLESVFSIRDLTYRLVTRKK